MKKPWMVGVGIGALVLGVALAGWAFERGRGMGPRGEEGHRAPFDRAQRMLALLDNDHFRSGIGLSDEQAERLRQIVVGAEKSSIQTGAELSVRRIELREMLRADNPDRDATMKKVDEISRLRAQLMKEHVDALLAAKSVLSPEQQKKFREYIHGRHEMEFRHGGGAGHPSMSAPPAGPPAKPLEPPQN